MCTQHVRVYSGVRMSPRVGRGGDIRDGKVWSVADSSLLAVHCSGLLPPFGPWGHPGKKRTVVTDPQSVFPGREVGEWWGEGGAGETPPRGFLEAPLTLRSDVGGRRAGYVPAVGPGLQGAPSNQEKAPGVTSIPSTYLWERV